MRSTARTSARVRKRMDLRTPAIRVGMGTKMMRWVVTFHSPIMRKIIREIRVKIICDSLKSNLE